MVAWRRVWPCARLWEHAYPAGAYFCMRKSRQNALGAVPQDPLTLKLRLDTNDAKHRPYSAADTLSRCLRRILFWILQGPN